jgi:hypothetical protein
VALRRHRARLGEGFARALGEQPSALGTVALESGKALRTAAEPATAQQAIDRAAGHADALAGQLSRELLRAEAGPGQRQREDLTLGGRIQLRRAPGPALPSLGMQAVGPVAHEALAQLVVKRAR